MKSRSGVAVGKGALGIFKRDVKHLGKILAERVRGGCLNATTCCGDVTLEGGCVQTTGKFFFVGFDALDYGHGQKVLINLAVRLEDLLDLQIGLSLGGESRVAFLPKELAVANEGLY